MTKVKEWIRRHQTVAYFLLTYLVSWAAWKTFDRPYLDGQVLALPFLMLGIFGPGLVSIWLSAVINPAPRQGSRRTGVMAFIVTWLPATLLVTLNQVLVEGRSASSLTVAVSAAAALMPAFVISSVFSTVPGVRRHLDSLLRPRGPAGYYLLALLLFAAIWSFGVLIGRALGLQVPQRELPATAARIGLVGAVTLDFFYNLIPNGLSEEVGWRGFALPRLQASRSPLVASLVLWVFWAVWHVPAHFGGFAAQSPVNTLIEYLMMLPVTIVFTWLFNRTKGSLLVVVLLHPAMNTATHFLPVTVSGIGLLVAFVIFVVIRDQMWRPQRAMRQGRREAGSGIADDRGLTQ